MWTNYVAKEYIALIAGPPESEENTPTSTTQVTKMKFTFALIALFTTATLAAPPLYDIPTSSGAMPRGSLKGLPPPSTCFWCGVRYMECMDVRTFFSPPSTFPHTCRSLTQSPTEIRGQLQLLLGQAYQYHSVLRESVEMRGFDGESLWSVCAASVQGDFWEVRGAALASSCVGAWDGWLEKERLSGSYSRIVLEVLGGTEDVERLGLAGCGIA